MDAAKGIEDRVAALEASCLAIRRLAHELNQPLTAVLGNAELLSMEVDGSEMAESVGRIVNESRRMSEIVQRLASEARKSTGDAAPNAV